MPSADRPVILYLTGLYPAVSHTFIQREVAALREMGFDIRTASVRRPDASHAQGSAERQALDDTFYILDAARSPARLLGALAATLRHPRRLAGALRLAWRTARPGLRGGLYQLFYLVEAAVLAAHLRRSGVGHLHNHFADQSASVAMLTAALSGVGFSYTLHGPAELYAPEAWQLAEKTARARFVACISHFARSQAMYFSDPVHWPKLRIIHCGVQPEVYATADARSGTDPGRVRLLFVGRLTPIKGVRVLIEAFALACRDRPGLQLALLGDGTDRRELEALAAPLGDRVQFLGYGSQQDVARELAASDALVLPSFAEGLPVVLMEAMASARPVIATAVAGVPELVEDGVSGLLVPAGDMAGLAAQIGRLADDADLRRRMGQAGRRKVVAEFDIRQEAARIGALFLGQGGHEPRPQPLSGATPNQEAG